MTTQSTIFGTGEIARPLPQKIKKKKVQREEKTQIRVCKYLRANYPNVIFTCDLASGMRLPVHIAKKNKDMRSSRGLPDMFIAFPAKAYSKPTGGHKPVRYFKQYYGLFMELKSEGVVVFNKDGSLRKDEHLQEQHEILKQLEEQGYKACFAIGFDEAKKIIDEYLAV